MRKRLPMSALITGLLAAPLVGGAVAPADAAIIKTAGESALVERFPQEMPADVAEYIRRWSRGQKLSAFGMQRMGTRLQRKAQSQITDALIESRVESQRQREAGENLFFIQQTTVPGGGENVSRALVRAIPTEKVPFLGVATTQVDGRLGGHLNLAKGIGLVVDYVEEGSPAAAAGISKDDVLEKFDDQLLVNQEQLRALVRMKKPGDTIQFTVIHAGKPVVANATLVEKEVPVVSVDLTPAPEAGTTRHTHSTSLQVDGDRTITRTQKDDDGEITLHKSKDGIQKLTVKDSTGSVQYEGDTKGLASSNLPANLKARVENFLKSDDARIDLGKSADHATGVSRTFTLNRSDGQDEITLKGDNDGRHLTVKNVGTGRVLYDGPANKADDFKSLPDMEKNKVQAMMDKVQLQFDQ